MFQLVQLDIDDGGILNNHIIAYFTTEEKAIRYVEKIGVTCDLLDDIVIYFSIDNEDIAYKIEPANDIPIDPEYV
jgi:hypothetical protein